MANAACSVCNDERGPISRLSGPPAVQSFAIHGNRGGLTKQNLAALPAGGPFLERLSMVSIKTLSAPPFTVRGRLSVKAAAALKWFYRWKSVRPVRLRFRTPGGPAAGLAGRCAYLDYFGVPYRRGHDAGGDYIELPPAAFSMIHGLAGLYGFSLEKPPRFPLNSLEQILCHWKIFFLI